PLKSMMPARSIIVMASTSICLSLAVSVSTRPPCGDAPLMRVLDAPRRLAPARRVSCLTRPETGLRPAWRRPLRRPDISCVPVLAPAILMSAAALTAVGMAVFMIMLVAVDVAMILPVRMRMIVAVIMVVRVPMMMMRVRPAAVLVGVRAVLEVGAHIAGGRARVLAEDQRLDRDGH